MRNLLAAVLVIGLGVILLIHYGLMWTHDEVRIYEHNKFMLGAETLMGIAVLVFGLERWRNVTRKLKEPKSKRGLECRKL